MRKLTGISLPLFGVIFCVTIFAPWTINAAKILGLFAHPGESHFSVMRSIVLELSRRGHSVTIYSSHRMHENVENLTEYVIEPEFPFWQALQNVAGIKTDATNDGGLQQLSAIPATSLQKHLATVGAAATEHFLSNKAVQRLIHSTDMVFDYNLIIVDLFYSEALMAFGHYYNTSTIGIVSTDFENYMQHTLESMLPIACSPIDFETYDPNAGYWTRLANTRDCLSRRKQFIKNNFAAQEKLITKHFAHFKAPTTPSIQQLQSELAVLLLNNHIPLMTPRPLLANIIPAGGLHIRPARELPWHLKRFLDEARAGVIYLNLGDEQLCGEVPKPQLDLFLEVLGHRKEHVIWTCHDVETLENAPKNILFQHMVPQADILAHPHVKAFIMNGDLLSLQEAIVRHVPMLGIPIFRNEWRNMKLAQHLGVGVNIELANLTTTSLNWALDTLLNDAEFQLRIRQVSTAFRDRPLGALETLLYWMDYAMRHNGGIQLKTRGLGIPSNQLHLFDLFLFYFAMAMLFMCTLVGVYYAATWSWRKHQTQKLYSKLN